MNPQIDKEEMKNYLLGTLDADRRMALEERILSESELCEELLLTEEELIDQYVAGGLSKTEQRQFETHFLITAERQKNLRFGKLLKRYIHSQPAAVHSNNVAAIQDDPSLPAVRRLFPFSLGSLRQSPALAFSAAVVACLGIVLLVCWLAVRKSVERTPQLDSSHLVEVTLAPGSTRSIGAATARITSPPKGYNVKLDLQLTNPSYPKYKSELFRENESLQTKDDLRAETKGDPPVVPWTISGDLLSPGDYHVRLSGVLDSGQYEFIDNYAFRVIE